MVGCSKSSPPAASNLVGGCSEIVLSAAAILLVLLLQHRLRPAGDERAGEEGREVTHGGCAAVAWGAAFPKRQNGLCSVTHPLERTYHQQEQTA